MFAAGVSKSFYRKVKEHGTGECESHTAYRSITSEGRLQSLQFAARFLRMNRSGHKLRASSSYTALF